MTAAQIAAIFVILAFAGLLSWLGLGDMAADVRTRSQHSLAILRNPTLEDDAKEAALQTNARALFKSFVRLTAGLGLALFLPILLIWGIARTGIFTFDAVIDASLTWPFLLGGFIVFVAALLRSKRS